MHPFDKQYGVTVIELLIGLTIAASLLLAAIPVTTAWVARYEQRQHAQALMQALYIARSEAIKRGHRVDVCPSPDLLSCDPLGRWHTGWIVFPDPDRLGHRTPDQPLIRVEGTAKPGITVAGNKPVADYVSYTDLGHSRRVNGALQMGTFTVCRHGQNAIDLVLANGGRVRMQETAIRCP
jgi:type IV fimbrial biogenesis protein FimT